ncbi:uncharacterized protein LOC124372845 [Homalodisca vitripennis]|uniref:uncharacterized protein LOC124372845 n=1 Tax=Homalodisca vitripennis TaxID=197043 RepID=UPI001EEA237D|nr:uncharacterized protein LOC124372845 [Homalodisca vitripennis]
MVAIKNNIASTRLVSGVSNIEHLLVKIEPFKGISWLLAACYIPPQQHVSSYNSLLSSIEEVSTEHKFHEIIVIGDFNLPGVDSADPLNCVHTSASRVMLSLMELYDLQQVNSIYNGRGVLLDLVLCTNKNTIVSLEIDALLPAEERHHPPLSIILHCSNRNTKGCTTKHFKPDFKRCNLWETYNSLSVVDFKAVLSSTDRNEATEKFLSTIAEAVKLNSPLRRVGVSPFPRWFSAETKDLVITKKTLHRQYKERDYRQHLGRVDQGVSAYLRFFWSHVNAIRNSSSLPSRMFYNDIESKEPQGMCELFRDFFSSVYTRPTEIFIPVSGDHFENSVFSRLSHQEVLSKLRKLDETKGWGPDEIPPMVLKHCGGLLAGPIFYLFNASLSSGVFPESFKISLRCSPPQKRGR